MTTTGSDLTFESGPHWAWQVAPARLGASVVERASPAVVVLPRFVHEASLEVEPVSRPQAASELLSQAQNLSAFGVAGALEAVAAVVVRCESYMVTFGDARSAAAAVVELVPSQAPSAAAPFRIFAASEEPRFSIAGACPAPDLNALCFDEGGVLLRGTTGEITTIDRIGALVWPLLVVGHGTIEAIAAELSAAFDAPAEDIVTDVTAWVEQLVERGVLTRS